MDLQPHARNWLRRLWSNLRSKLILFTVLILSTFIGISLWMNLGVLETQLVRSTRERTQFFVEAVEKGIVALMLEGRGKEVQDLVEAMATHGAVHHVRILGPDGMVLHSSLRKEIGTPAIEDLRLFQSQATPVVSERRRERHRTYAMVTPIYNRPQCHRCHGQDHPIRGLLSVEVSAQPEEEQLREVQTAMLTGGATLLGVMVVALVLVQARFVNAPIRSLMETMSRVQNGEASVRAPVRSQDEFGQLARHFNAMISDLELAREELEQFHQAQMERADKLATVGELAAGVAHEIKNPLAGISGAIQVLSQAPGSSISPAIVREIQGQVQRMDRAVKNLLSYARPTLPCLQEVRLDEIVEHALLLLREMARKQGVTVEKSLSPLPPLVADGDQLQQVFLNLFLNAMQAMPQGGTLRVSASLKRYDEDKMMERPVEDIRTDVCHWVEIQVEDTGVGISSEAMEDIFKPFHTTKSQGTGLGLAICRRIVHQHGGMITVRSQPNRGTYFTVFLPYRESLQEVKPSHG